MRLVVLTMDNNHDTALRQAVGEIQAAYGIEIILRLYDATDFNDEGVWNRLDRDLERADFIFGCMLFKEEIVDPLLTRLQANTTPACFITSTPSLIRSTRLGRFVMQPRATDAPPGLLARWIKKLQPKKGRGSGAHQMAILRNLGKVMRHIPGKAQDIHTFMVVHDFWLQGSPENLKRMLCLLMARYVPGHAHLPIEDPIQYPENAIHHPDAPGPFASLEAYEGWRAQTRGKRPWVGRAGVLTFKVNVLGGNTDHVDALIRALEARDIEARTVYASGLDSRPAIDAFFFEPTQTGRKTAQSIPRTPSIDVFLNSVGFALVGGPASARPEEGQAMLEELDVGYYDLIPLSFQRVEDWKASEVGLVPMQTAMNIAIPELDGVIEPLIYAGQTVQSDRFVPLPEQIEIVADRVAHRLRLVRRTKVDKRIGIVLFNFPPNMGNAGTAAYLDVFASLHRLLSTLKEEGYTVDLPDDAVALRKRVVEGNATQFGTDGNVADHLSIDDYRALFPHHIDLEPFWGPAPGELLTDGKRFHILGAQFGNIFVGVQPSFGYERDPMRLLMGKGCAPHHGFAAFYSWLKGRFDADALIHFGTHGALEFMPGKQVGLSADDWPPRLLGSLPNFYYYSVNNPSEGAIAKRRGAATLFSYLVPPLQQAGLYKGLRVLKDGLEQYYARPSSERLADLLAQAERLGIVLDRSAFDDDARMAAALGHELLQVEHRMIPMGLHVLGTPPEDEALVDILSLVAAFNPARKPNRSELLPTLPELIATGLGWRLDAIRGALQSSSEAQAQWERIEAVSRAAMLGLVHELRRAGGVPARMDLARLDAVLEREARIRPGQLENLWFSLGDLLTRMGSEEELRSLIRALDGGYTPPSPGNDVVRNQAVVPTGRNLHALDPFRVPTPAALESGGKLVRQMLERLERENGALPETVAMVLWGTDNLKSECEGVAQVFSLLGVRPVADEIGNISRLELIPLSELGRPRIDVVMTVSGIFRDLLDHQLHLLDRAVRMVATAPEPPELNFVRKHAGAQAEAQGVSLEAAATRVFSNAPGAYGANVNHMVESSTWENDDELADVFLTRKSFAFQPGGSWTGARAQMEASLSTVDATFQNIDSFELGISDVDHYYEYLGGVAKTVEKLRGKRPPVLVADAISQGDRLASLEQMVRLESRAKLLNPKWFEAMLEHGYEGVREIENRVSNTYGWSATTASVEGWVYDDISETFLLDEVMRARMAEANPHATAAIARRLLEAESRGFWDADETMLDRLREIYGDLEDRLEGVSVAVGVEAAPAAVLA